MSNIKISYFDFAGRAEAIRLAFVLGDIPFDDHRVKFPNWPAMKPTTPYGSLPVATIDGETVAQSSALLLYVGKLSGMYPSDPKAALRVDEVLATLDDALTAAFTYQGSDKEELKASREKYLKEVVPRYIGGLEKRLEVFGNGPYACGDSLSIADLGIVGFITEMMSGIVEHVPADAFDGYPRMMALYNAVRKLPKVKEWYKNCTSA